VVRPSFEVFSQFIGTNKQLDCLQTNTEFWQLEARNLADPSAKRRMTDIIIERSEMEGSYMGPGPYAPISHPPLLPTELAAHDQVIFEKQASATLPPSDQQSEEFEPASASMQIPSTATQKQGASLNSQSIAIEKNDMQPQPIQGIPAATSDHSAGGALGMDSKRGSWTAKQKALSTCTSSSSGSHSPRKLPSKPSIRSEEVLRHKF